MADDESRFLELAPTNPAVAAMLGRAPLLGARTDEGPSCPPSLAR
jgi:hypothetical protein